jgi:hypothetical protein
MRFDHFVVGIDSQSFLKGVRRIVISRRRGIDTAEPQETAEVVRIVLNKVIGIIKSFVELA